MSKPRIALILYQLRYGGAERALTYLARGFFDAGYDVDFLIRNTHETAYQDDLSQGVQLREIQTAGKLNTRLFLMRQVASLMLRQKSFNVEEFSLPQGRLRMLPGVVDYLRREQPTALLTTMPQNNIMALWARRIASVPMRVVIREANTISMMPSDENSGFGRIAKGLARRWYPEADGIISVCDGVGDDLSAYLGIERGRIHTIYNPVDLERIIQLSQAPPPHPWLENKSQPVIVTAGRLQPQKNHPLLLEALALLNNQQSIRLIIVGDGLMKEELQQQAERLGIQDRVAFTGNVANPYAYMARADVFVLSSAWEGFPNVLLEALACRIPIVSTDCPSGGPAELLQSGRYGRMVQVNDPEGMKNAIAETLIHPGDTQAGFAYVSSFTMKRSVGNYLKFLVDE